MNEENHEEQLDTLMDHSYDGIQEYDNPMPKWWLYMLYGSIVYAFLYFGYYTAYESTMETLAEEDSPVTWSDKRLALEIIANTPEDTVQWDLVNGSNLSSFVSDKSLIHRGKSLFASKCSACHGGNGEGGVGPNLTDNYWLHGASLQNIYATVADGANNGAMPPWKKELGNKNVVSLVSYLQTIKGKGLPGKEPQGELVSN